MITWLFCIGCVIFLRQGSISLAEFSNVLISSPNTSPFYRFPYKTSPSHSTCPLDSDHLNEKHLEIRSCGLLLDDNLESKNVSVFINESTMEKDPLAMSIKQGNSINGNVSHIHSPSPPPLPPAKLQIVSKELPERPPIVTFDEWTKEKLRLGEFRKNNQHRIPEKAISSGSGFHESPSASVASENVGDYATNGQTLRSMSIEQQSTLRNYASKECGAKVLFSNAEAENRNAILNEKEADDYMRNPCERAQQKWVVFELCETIQPTKLEIANFELFSSSPKEFRVLGSERYPSNDWVPLGDFIAEDTRNVQSFPVPTNHVYVKFIRLELLTHYGREHYCTLSLMRVFGVSIVDEYEAEAEAAAAPVAEPHQTTAISESPLPQILQNTVNNEELIESSSSISVANDGMSEKQSQTAFNSEPLSSKQKDRHIVDTVVDVMGNIAIANIKNVLESAFLRGWKRKAPCAKCSGMSLEWMCRSCPTSNPPVLDLMFCRAFFGVGIKPKKKNNDVLKKSTKLTEIAQPNQMHQNVQGLLNCSQCGSGITETQLKFLSEVLERTCPVDFVVSANTESFTALENATLFENSTLEFSRPVNFDKKASKLKMPQTLPGGVMSHKESVFLKLNKRINALELNMSLSSEYLSELSRRYVEKVNESEKQTERTVKMAETVALNAVRDLRTDMESKLEKLTKDLMEIEKHVKFFTRNAFFLQSSLWRKTVALEDDKTSRSINEVPKSGFNKETNVLTASSELLYSNDHLWTTEQLIFMVVVAQGSTVIVMLFIQFCYNRKSWNEVHHLQTMVNDHIAKGHAGVAKNNAILPVQNVEKPSKRKRNKRRKQLLQDNIEEVGHAATLLLSSGKLCNDVGDDRQNNICGNRCDNDVDTNDVNSCNNANSNCKGTIVTSGVGNGKVLSNDLKDDWKMVRQESPLSLSSFKNLCIDPGFNSQKCIRSEFTDRPLSIQNLKADCVPIELKDGEEECVGQLYHKKFVEKPCWNIAMKRRRQRAAANAFKRT